VKKFLVMTAFALLTTGGFLSVASAGDTPPPPLLPGHPPPPADCMHAILVISPDPEVGAYWLCLDGPGH